MNNEVDYGTKVCPICGKEFKEDEGVQLYTLGGYPVCIVCMDCAYGEF